MLSHSDRLSLHATLQGPATPDGPDRSLDDMKELDPIWTRDLAFGDPAGLLAGTGPREQTCSSIVAGAASRLVSKLGWRGAAPDLQHQAEQALLAELAERFGPLDIGIARRPEIHELAHEIIAEARAEAAARAPRRSAAHLSVSSMTRSHREPLLALRPRERRPALRSAPRRARRRARPPAPPVRRPDPRPMIASGSLPATPSAPPAPSRPGRTGCSTAGRRQRAPPRCPRTLSPRRTARAGS